MSRATRILKICCVLSMSVLWARAASAQTIGADDLTHWEAYKSITGHFADEHLTDPVLQGAIDLHAHYGPDVYPRYADAFEVVALAADRGMRAIVIKNHFTESASIAALIRKHGAQGIEVFGGIAMNTTIGGVNPQALRFMIDSSNGLGRIVWLPTHDSAFEVAYNRQTRRSVTVTDDQGHLLPQTLEVLDLISANHLTLATGHLAGVEVLKVIDAARARGIEHIIVTHPMLGGQYTDMSLPQLDEAVAKGAYVEFVATEFENPQHAAQIIETLRHIGPAHGFVSSDSGLVNHRNHTDALVLGIRALRDAGFSEDELSLLFRDNPAKLIGLPVLR